MVDIVVSLMVDPWYNGLMAGGLMVDGLMVGLKVCLIGGLKVDGLMVGLEVGLMLVSWFD
jgi:hypothetical protein